jgi:hypothetical protein
MHALFGLQLSELLVREYNSVRMMEFTGDVMEICIPQYRQLPSALYS